jgi:UMF1 family MFS transporter
LYRQMSKRRQVIAWAFYDWANSAFATTVMAGFFPLFFKAYWADPADPAGSTFVLGWANSGASILVALSAPFLGAIADRATAKKRFLYGFTALGAASTGALWCVAQGQWAWAAALYVTGTVGFMGANIFYDSLLPAVAESKRVDFVSSLGFGFGYIGGGLLFALNVAMYLKPAVFGIPDGATAIRLSFLMVAFWWALFTLPLVFWVDEPVFHSPATLGQAIRGGWRQLLGTAKDIRHLRVVGLFLLAYWLYIDGVDTIVRMAVDYGMSIGFAPGSLITGLLLVQFVAFPAAIAYGWIAQHTDAKRMVLIAIVGYIGITILAYFMHTEAHFYWLAGLVGLFQGGIQALSRSLYSRIIPKSKAAEFYGFYNMLGKFAAVIGPALMGTITLVTGNPRLGILSIVLLFIGGGLLLLRVDIDAGAREAEKFLAR